MVIISVIFVRRKYPSTQHVTMFPNIHARHIVHRYTLELYRPEQQRLGMWESPHIHDVIEIAKKLTQARRDVTRDIFL
jgi:hypothetical protein